MSEPKDLRGVLPSDRPVGIGEFYRAIGWDGRPKEVIVTPKQLEDLVYSTAPGGMRYRGNSLYEMDLVLRINVQANGR